MTGRASRKKRVVVLTHTDLIPPENVATLTPEELSLYKTDGNVIDGLKKLGHEVEVIGLTDELTPLRLAIKRFKPHVVFNLLEEFAEQSGFDSHVVAYLELTRTPYTGCNPRGLMLARDKALSKKVLTYHRIRVPKFAVFPRYRKMKRPNHLQFPLIVKSLIEEASLGIAQASIVRNDKALQERIAFIHDNIRTDAVVEQYIKGRELYAAVIGNHRLQVLPTWELFMDSLPESAPKIATRRVKWDLKFQKKYEIKIGRARGLSAELEDAIAKTSRRICRRLGTDGYVRLDFRLAEDGQLYFIEANPNPDIGKDEEVSRAAKAKGIGYEALLEKIVNLGIRRATKG